MAKKKKTYTASTFIDHHPGTAFARRRVRDVEHAPAQRVLDVPTAQGAHHLVGNGDDEVGVLVGVAVGAVAACAEALGRIVEGHVANTWRAGGASVGLRSAWQCCNLVGLSVAGRGGADSHA